MKYEVRHSFFAVCLGVNPRNFYVNYKVQEIHLFFWAVSGDIYLPSVVFQVLQEVGKCFLWTLPNQDSAIYVAASVDVILIEVFGLIAPEPLFFDLLTTLIVESR